MLCVCIRRKYRLSQGGLDLRDKIRVEQTFTLTARRQKSVLTSRKHNPDLTPLAKALRKNMTPEERHLWYDFLRDYPVRFLRQKVIDNYIVDFYCHDARLIVELDGSGHYSPEAEALDRARTAHLNLRGLKVIRIPNNEVKENFRGVCEYIDGIVRGDIEIK